MVRRLQAHRLEREQCSSPRAALVPEAWGMAQGPPPADRGAIRAPAQAGAPAPAADRDPAWGCAAPVLR